MNAQRTSQPSVLAGVFDGLRFPAARWEIVTRAVDYGLGGRTLAVLWELEPGGARSLHDLVDWLTARTTDRG